MSALKDPPSQGGHDESIFSVQHTEFVFLLNDFHLLWNITHTKCQSIYDS